MKTLFSLMAILLVASQLLTACGSSVMEQATVPPETTATTAKPAGEGILISTSLASSSDLTPTLTPTPLSGNDLVVNRTDYRDRLRAFWLSESIANWTGLQSEGMRTWEPYYTDNDWSRRNFKFNVALDPFGSDDDTDIEYIYLHALDTYKTEILTGPQIRDQWLEHIDGSYVWVSDETAYWLMVDNGMVPPDTSLPVNNPNWEMIDAQLTTESFGFYAPARPTVALAMGQLPVRTTAYGDAAYAAQFYIIMYSLAPYAIANIHDTNGNGSAYDEQVFWLAAQARSRTPSDSYIAKIYDWVLDAYNNNPDKNNWEVTRDAFHDHYIAQSNDGYLHTQWWDSGSNFGLSMISLMFGQGDLKRTVQIAMLSGMDSDNPTSTWGGLLGFLYGYKGVQEAYNYYNFSDIYWIGRTRVNFPAYDTFTAMADRGVSVIDRVVVNQMGGSINGDNWIIPNPGQ